MWLGRTVIYRCLYKDRGLAKIHAMEEENLWPANEWPGEERPWAKSYEGRGNNSSQRGAVYIPALRPYQGDEDLDHLMSTENADTDHGAWEAFELMKRVSNCSGGR